MALIGMSGTLIPLFLNFIEPTSLFALNTSVLALAMPMIGGTSHWIGPIIGAVLLGTMQQMITVTISSEVNVLLVGLVLVIAVVAAPKGIIGLVQQFTRKGHT
jgi:branched-chain amino acid transport system permease protein